MGRRGGRGGSAAALWRVGDGARWRVAVALVLVGALSMGLHHARRRAEERWRAQVDSLARSQAALAESEHRYRQLFDLSPTGIGMVDHAGTFMAVNAAMGDIVGRDPAEVVGATSAVYTHPQDVHLVARAPLADGATVVRSVRKRVVRPDGEVRWVDVAATTSAGADGRAWTVGHMQDVTRVVQAEQALRQAQQDMAAVAEVVRRMHSGDDVRSAIVTAARIIAGATSATLLEPDGLQHLVISAAAGPDLTGLRISLDDTTATGHVWRTGEGLFVADPADHPLVSPSLHGLSSATSMMWQPVQVAGTVLAVLAVSWPYRVAGLDDRAARAVRVLATEAAVALERESLIRSLESLATTDPLTGLANRRSWDAGLAAAFERAARGGAVVSVAILDIDHFKAYNDEHGHAAGDEVLRAFAGAAGAVVRDVDLLARWGGEEFALLLADCPGADDALRAVERVRVALPGAITCSAGLATWDGSESPQQLMQRADAALYAAKSGGRDRAVAAPTVAPGVLPGQRTL